MNRRGFLAAAGVTAASAAVSVAIWQRLAEAPPSRPELNTDLSTFLDELCDLVIPDTETPGAKSVGVASWLVLAIDSELEGLNHDAVIAFEQQLNKAAPFISLPRDQRMHVLTAIDQQAFAQPPQADEQETQHEILETWRRLKTLILMGYYSSEVGASQELRYKLVPGRFVPDLVVDENTKAWANDWTAVDFG